MASAADASARTAGPDSVWRKGLIFKGWAQYKHMYEVTPDNMLREREATMASAADVFGGLGQYGVHGSGFGSNGVEATIASAADANARTAGPDSVWWRNFWFSPGLRVARVSRVEGSTDVKGLGQRKSGSND